MSQLRFKVVDEAFNRKAEPVEIPKERPESYYGKYVFNRQKMFQYLPAKTFDALIYAIDNKEPLPREVADSVAEGLTGGKPSGMCPSSFGTAYIYVPTIKPKMYA